MWGLVLVMSLLIALNPLRLGFTLLMISRPRPLQNLLAYWVGNLTSCIPTVVIPLTLLNVTPMFKSFAEGLAKSSTVRHLQLGMGVLVLSIAVLMTVRFLARPRAELPTPDGNMSTLVLDPNTSTAISRLLGLAQDAPTEGGSAIRRLLARARDAWETGALWVAFVIGLGNFPAPDAALLVLAIIVTSGAAIGTQVTAAFAFVVGVSAVVEITLVSYLAAPAKTTAVLRPLHDWAWANRRKILLVMLAVAGVMMVTQGMGSI